ncbi:unnamed protein product [Rotaria socialis]|uniref:Paired domain-containing protein n=2 Tax=Rotaria socialis TaxID=392032 RepID=A0A820J7A8_9BILA|nr:unnamed protein product [Rotaria socialis]CAF4736466.1 unnamed protein product [Rotaria socialis]
MLCARFKHCILANPYLFATLGRKAVDTAIKRSIIVLRDSGMPQHEISRKLKISRHYVQQTIRKFNEFHTVATKPGAGRHSKLTNRQNRAIKLQQVRDDTLSLTDLSDTFKQVST